MVSLLCCLQTAHQKLHIYLSVVFILYTMFTPNFYSYSISFSTIPSLNKSSLIEQLGLILNQFVLLTLINCLFHLQLTFSLQMVPLNSYYRRPQFSQIRVFNILDYCKAPFFRVSFHTFLLKSVFAWF